MKEKWHQIYDLNYEISNFGNIRNKIKKTILKSKITIGYHSISIGKKQFSINGVQILKICNTLSQKVLDTKLV